MITMDNTFYKQRNLAIDMLRAFTMFVMIFVNDFWKISDVPHVLEHAAYGEDFMGLADVVFPCFLFAVGLSIPYAIERRIAKGLSVESTLTHIFGRTFALLMMGVFIGNSESGLAVSVPYPIGVYWILMVLGFLAVWNDYTKVNFKNKYAILLIKGIGVSILCYLAITFRSSDAAIFGAKWGILGMIGFAYACCSIIYVLVRSQVRYLWAALFFLLAVAFFRTPMRQELGGLSIFNLPQGNFIDGFISLFHIGNGVLPAFAMAGVMLSVSLARFVDQPKPRIWIILSVTALLSAIVGFVAHNYWIISKIGATPPWFFYVVAIAILLYVLMDLLVAKKWTGWFTYIKPAGTATLTTYLIPYVFYAIASLGSLTLPQSVAHGAIGLLNCLIFSWFVIFTAGLLEKYNIKLKI